MNKSKYQPDDIGTGYLVVNVTTASGAIPLIGATVTIRSNGEQSEKGNVITTLLTDRNGNTERLALPAPSRSLSQQPENTLPFSTYNIDVILDKYQKNSFFSVPIFDGITSIQQVDLIPLPENGRENNYDPYSEKTFESSAPDL